MLSLGIAMESIVGIVCVALLADMAWVVRRGLRELRAANAEAKAERKASDARDKAFWARDKAEREAFWARGKAEREAFTAGLREATSRADRNRAAAEGRANEAREESIARADRDRGLNVREYTQLTDAIGGLSKAVAELSSEVADIKGDVKVLLDRSNRSSGGGAAPDQPTTRYGVAHQATPPPREDE